MGTKIIMPEMGEGIIEAVVAQWLKAEGERVEQYDPILEIETDKVTTEATAEAAGTLLKIFVEAGETVPVGTLLGFIGEPGEAVPGGDEQELELETAAAEPVEARAAYTPKPKGTNGSPQPAKRRYTGRISPVVGRIAAENDIDLDLVPGTGKDGRITKQDVMAYLEKGEEGRGETAVATPSPQTQLPPPQPTIQPVPASPQSGEILPLTAMRRGIADHMVRSKHTSPHVTTVFEFD